MGRYPTGEGWEMEESKEKENSLREEKCDQEGKTQAGSLKKGGRKHHWKKKFKSRLLGQIKKDNSAKEGMKGILGEKWTPILIVKRCSCTIGKKKGKMCSRRKKEK